VKVASQDFSLLKVRAWTGQTDRIKFITLLYICSW